METLYLIGIVFIAFWAFGVIAYQLDIRDRKRAK